MCTQCVSGAAEWPGPQMALVEPASEGPGAEEGIKRRRALLWVIK